jgi:AcrR family transcriptional regulator
VAVQSGVYRGQTVEDRVADRRRRLVEAALAVWADDDTKVTMTGICVEAGLTERYFYESFGGLDDALTAVMDEIADDIEARSSAAADAAGDDPAARVAASVTAFVHLMAEDPRKGRVALIQAGALPKQRRRRTELLRHFAHLCADAARELGLGPLSQRDAETAGLLFIGGMAELITAWLEGELVAEPQDIVDAATRMFLGLYA